MTIDKKFWSNKNIVITGHTGFKGSWLAVFLNELGANLFGISREKKKGIYTIANISSLFKYEDFLDLSENFGEDNLKNLIEFDPEIVFHFAAQSLVYVGYSNPLDTLKSNIIGSYNLLNNCLKLPKIKSVITSTTDKVYKFSNSDNVESSQLGGKDFYSSSKVGVENVITAFLNSYDNFNISTVRSGNVLGGGDRGEKRLITDLVNALISEEKFLMRKPNSIRPWQSVFDSLYGYLLVAQENYKEDKSEIYNLNSKPNNQYTSQYIAEKFVSLWNSKIEIEVEDKEHFKEVDILKINSTKANDTLGWKPQVKIDDLIQQIVDWELYYLKNNDTNFSIQQAKQYLALVSK